MIVRRPTGEQIALPDDDGLVMMNGELVPPEILHQAAAQRIAFLRMDGKGRPSQIKRYRLAYGGMADLTTPSFREFVGAG